MLFCFVVGEPNPLPSSEAAAPLAAQQVWTKNVSVVHVTRLQKATNDDVVQLTQLQQAKTKHVVQLTQLQKAKEGQVVQLTQLHIAKLCN